MTIQDFWALDKALYQAWGTYPDVDYNAISVMAPVYVLVLPSNPSTDGSNSFLNQMDIDAGAAAGVNGTLFWNGTTWMSGHYNIGPDTFANISSYDVMDDLVDYYLNKTVFPNLDVRATPMRNLPTH